MSRVLLLSPWMAPLKVISWETAITLYYLKKVDVLESYDEEIKSPSVTMKVPAVVRLRTALDMMKRGIKFSRVNLFMRDNFRCQYCGERKKMRELTYDHVTPRVKGGKTVWDNIVAACYACNDRKADKTVREAGMRLLRAPFKPKSLPLAYLQLERQTIPEIWEPYCAGARGIEEDRKGIFLMTGTS
jgi:5-methylcytosine-specific restriction endonuclease McrA